MCIEALPEHLKTPAAWKGTDHDTWWARWFIPIKLKYLCFGPRDSHPWHKWREWPKTLFAIKSKQGVFRIESEDENGSWEDNYHPTCTQLFNTQCYLCKDINSNFIETCLGYLSRIQYYCRWHLQIQWPFFIAFHFYFRKADVPKWGELRSNTDSKLLYFYVGAHRDADRVYWIPSVYIGLNWK